jgi:hypothetical protein
VFGVVIAIVVMVVVRTVLRVCLRWHEHGQHGDSSKHKQISESTHG